MSALPPVADPTASMPPPTATESAPAPVVASSTLAAPAPTAPRPTVLATPTGRPVPAAPSTTAPTTKASSKSKKKQAVTMATAATAQSSGASGGSSGENTGRWTAEEHNLFLQGLELHGKGWKKIAGLIKSRTVVQIRTHAQKYFQKLAKAKQNGEDVSMAGGSGSNTGAVPGAAMTMMMGEGGRSALSGGVAGANAPGSAMSASSAAGAGHPSAHSSKRRKQTSGTKRKAIQSVVASARRQGNKKLAVTSTARKTSSPEYEQAVNGTGIAPALAPYVLPTPLSAMTSQQPAPQGAIGVTALEDSLFRYLTPNPVVNPETQVNSVARQAGANPITLPTNQPGVTNTLSGGEVSPTGVNDFDLYPSWTDYNKEAPSWYAKGSDVDALLDVADSLDWLTDTGDLTETYEEAERLNAADATAQTTEYQLTEGQPPKDVAPLGSGAFYADSNNTATMSMNTLPRIDSGVEVNVPPLPPLFDGDGVTDNGDEASKSKLSSLHMSSVPSVANLDEHLFSSPVEEHEFMSTILDETGAGSSVSLAALGATP